MEGEDQLLRYEFTKPADMVNDDLDVCVGLLVYVCLVLAGMRGPPTRPPINS